MLGGVFLDAAGPSQLYFQDGSTLLEFSIEGLHDHIMFFCVIIVVGVLSMISNTLYFYSYKVNSFVHKYLTHGTLIEIIWTISPALILINIIIPSLKLLYWADEVLEPAVTIKIVGHQWFWSYEYADYQEKKLFDSYMVPEEELNEGNVRLLEVDNRIILPVSNEIRLLVSAEDVLHSWAVPSLGVKIDAAPGRLNQVLISIERTGVFYGQCSELCGVQHGFMPIVVECLPLNDFIEFIKSNEDVS